MFNRIFVCAIFRVPFGNLYPLFQKSCVFIWILLWFKRDDIFQEPTLSSFVGNIQFSFNRASFSSMYTICSRSKLLFSLYRILFIQYFALSASYSHYLHQKVMDYSESEVEINNVRIVIKGKKGNEISMETIYGIPFLFNSLFVVFSLRA